MQKIERYGVLALLLLVITLVAVGAWGERPGEETPVANQPSRAQIEQFIGQTAQDPPQVVAPQVAANRFPADPKLSLMLNTGTQASAESRQTQDASSARVQRALDAMQRAEPQPQPQAQIQEYRRVEPSGAPIGRSNQFNTNPKLPERVHIVRSGEVFSTIVENQCGGRRFNGQVLALNPGLNPDRIRVGQRILLPVRNVSLKTEDHMAKTSSPPVAPLEGTSMPTSQPSGRLRSLSVYRVQSGDMLSRIISANCPPGVNLDDVVALNHGMDPNRIFVGQELRLPRSTNRSAAPPSSKRAPKETPSGPTHRVRSGDVLSRIASGWGCSIASLVSVNPGLNPDRIRVGQLLQLPPRSLGAQLKDAPRLAKASGLGGRSWSGVK
jgi:LysM repeat protein